MMKEKDLKQEYFSTLQQAISAYQKKEACLHEELVGDVERCTYK